MTQGFVLDSSSSAPNADRLVGRPFVRMNGVGNRIVVLDLRGCDATLSAAQARAIAASPGLAFDQLMAIHDPREAATDAFVSIYNTDGSLSGACGNGTRCVAWVMARDGAADDLVLTTSTSRIACRRIGPRRFAVDMGRPSFDAAAIPVLAPDPAAVSLGLAADAAFGPAFAVGIGNPHAVFFVPDADMVDLAVMGHPVEHAKAFPERCNVSFAQVLDRATIRLRVWERGAGATLGCGTGACATLLAAAATGRTGRTARVELPGGALAIEWSDDDHVIMTGPVELEGEGVLEPSHLGGRAA